MKAIIMFGSLVLGGTVLVLFFDKVSIMKTYFDLGNSPIWSDIFFLLLGLSLVVPRSIAIYQKLFLSN